MGSMANMLLAQAAPQGDALSGLSPEAQAALRALNGQGGVPEAPAPEPTPTPAPAAPAPSQGIGDMLIGWLSSLLPSTQSLAPKPQATPKPIFSGQEAGDAAIEAERKRNQQQPQQ